MAVERQAVLSVETLPTEPSSSLMHLETFRSVVYICSVITIMHLVCDV